MPSRPPSQETPFAPVSAYVMLVVELLVLGGAIASFVVAGRGLGHETAHGHGREIALVLGGVALLVGFVVCLPGFFVTQPNVARVLVVFGRYRGTVRDPGFWWTNPFTLKTKLSLRA